MKRQIITFAGDKEALHKQLKAWCVEAEQSVNKTVIELIYKHLKKYENKNNKLKRNG